MIAKWLGVAATVALGASTTGAPAYCQQYPFLYNNGLFTTLDVPGSTETDPGNINNSGEVVGAYYNGSTAAHGFIYSKGIYTTVDFPGASDTVLVSVNNFVEIAGYYIDTSGRHGFTYSGGLFTAPNLPPDGYPSSINDAGQLIGAYYQPFYPGATNYGSLPFFYSAGIYTTLIPPGQINFPTAVAINNSGQVIGNYSVKFTPNQYGYLYSNGIYTTIGVPGSITTNVSGINDDGEIVGLYDGLGFLYSNGVYMTIKVPGSIFTAAEDINNLGEIIGIYEDAGSNGFLGFMFYNGVYTTIDAGVPYSYTVPNLLNDSGQILGTVVLLPVPSPRRGRCC